MPSINDQKDKSTAREELRKREREYKKNQRARDQLSRAIENKYNNASQPQKILLNLDEDIIKGLNQFTNDYEMSRRSRTVLINNFLRARLKQIDEISKLAEDSCKNSGTSTQKDMRAMAMEIAITGGDRKDLADAINQYNDHIKKIGNERGNKTVMPSDINFNDLEVFKSLNKQN
tara:strand:+ start:1533 stop:2057 length:525 start_codon:yes stop_codon:yes gene_type:complete